ncbi:Metallo-dependent phosphatase-like protein [Cladorrhinum sp. PSN332]|nr:Metallo-dependent phosphatase-like protein [Cladorrhinum sp. PSN332]
MIPQAITHCLNRRAPRSTLFLIFGSLSFLTLCIFLLHLPSLKQVSRIPIFGVQDEKEVVLAPGQPGMTSSSTPAGAPTSKTLPPQPPTSQEEQPHHQNTNPHNNIESGQTPITHINNNEEVEDDSLPEMTQYTNHHPPILPSPTLIADLPSSAILPSLPHPTSSSAPKSRIIVVGDVHGNLGPLKELLKKIEFSPHNNYNLDSGIHHPHHGKTKTKDHLIFVGDMITRGPDSRGVVDLAMKVGASAVRGNHEDRVLAAARGMKRLDRNEWTARDIAGENQYNSDESSSSTSASSANPEDLETFKRKRKKKKTKDDHARKIAKSLSRSQLHWLESLPIILRIGHFPPETTSPLPPWDAAEIVVVHGGLVPGVKLESQDPWAVMNMRSLLYPRHNDDDDDGDDDNDDDEYDDKEKEDEFAPQNTITVPIDTRKGEPWSRAWNRYQNFLASSSSSSSPNTTTATTTKTTVVIYGHDARAGLQADMEVDISDPQSPRGGSRKNGKKKKKNKKKAGGHGRPNKGVRYAFGLDSGCGHGKQLTALVIEGVEGDAEGKDGKMGVGHRLVQVDCGLGVHGVDGQEGEGE